MRPLTCLVTGASRGIGYSIANELLFAGHRVVCTWNRSPGLIGNLEASFPEKVVDFRLDGSKPDSCRELKNHLDTLGWVPMVLVNNAGISQEKPMEFITDSDWDNMFQCNLMGPVRLAGLFCPAMVKNKWGRIFNICSSGGQIGGIRQVHYAAMKAALINFTKSLARVYGREGIVPIALALGLFETEMTAAELASIDGAKKLESMPAGRSGKPEEVGHLVANLIGKGGDFLHGQTINLNGGLCF